MLRYVARIMAVVDEILAERDCGVVHCGVSRFGHKEVRALANEFGLYDDPSAFAEVSASQAHSLVTSILHKDMAYSQPLMTEDRAQELTKQFFAKFGGRARFYSNGWPDAWNPATDATFDTGVLVLGEDCAGCLWVEDED